MNNRPSTKRKNLALIALTSLAIQNPSGFAATTGSITISGSVAAATSITVTSVSGYNSLDLSTTASNLVVAQVREKNNTNLGYRVTLSSANSGYLKNGSLGQIQYTAKYDGNSTSLSSSAVNITNASASSSVVNVQKPFSISYTGVDPATLMQGTYSDTLTFTISSP